MYTCTCIGFSFVSHTCSILLNNSITCDCNVRWLFDFLLTKGLTSPLCVRPQGLLNVELTKLVPEDFCCKYNVSFLILYWSFVFNLSILSYFFLSSFHASFHASFFSPSLSIFLLVSIFFPLPPLSLS